MEFFIHDVHTSIQSEKVFMNAGMGHMERNG